MANIKMCLNEDCTLKNKCYRYKAAPNPYMQSYSDFKQDDKGECSSFEKI